ncbi:hypothetical protein I4U23_030393 [Adineta vaga]|nr:hypothetical protein I4U23_030393 [Adineta vaga]
MSTVHMPEIQTNEEYINSREEQWQRYPSTNSSTPNSSIGEKQFQFSTNNNERSGQNSRTSSFAESITTASINMEGFSNFCDIIQHLQKVWFDHNHNDGSRRTGNSLSAPPTNNTHMNETNPSHYSKGHSHSNSSSQQHYTHQHSGQQYWNTYNPRRSGNGNYTRNYSGGNNDTYWNPKTNRFPSHRSMNALMTNSANYHQQSQSSPPTQRRQGDQQYYHNEQQHPSQSYYKKNRSDHDRRSNGHYIQHQHSVDYATNNLPSEQSNINSTQSYPSNLNSYN